MGAASSNADRIGLGEFALRAATPASGAWFVLIVPASEVGIVGDMLARQIDAMGLGPVTTAVVLHDAAALAEQFRASSGVLLLCGVDQISDEEWQQIDLRRSVFARKHPVILVLSEATTRRLARLAPNLASWIGGSEFVLDGAVDLFSESEIAERLIRLREEAGLDDAEVIRRAESRELPSDPQFAEWLFLLGRSDLIGH